MAVALSSIAFAASKKAANSACIVIHYEPEQPKELENLKKHRV